MGCSNSRLRFRHHQSVELLASRVQSPNLLRSETPTLIKPDEKFLPGAASQIDVEQPLLHDEHQSAGAEPPNLPSSMTTSPTNTTGNVVHIVEQPPLGDGYDSPHSITYKDPMADEEDVMENTQTVKNKLSFWDKVMRDRCVLIPKSIQGIIFRALDTGLDFRTAAKFFMDGEVEWAWLTLTFIMINPMIQFAFVWHKTGNRELAFPFLIPGSIQHLRREWRHLRLIQTLPQVALFQNVHVLAGAAHLNEVLAAIECCFESLPQACIQGRAYHVDGRADLLNYLSLSCSLIGVSVGVFFGAKALLANASKTTGSRFTDMGVRQVALTSSTGDTLSIDGFPLDTKSAQALASFIEEDEFITSCVLSGTNCNDDNLKLFANAGRLVAVDLSGCTQVTDEGVAKLAENCKQLTQVDLRMCDEITDEGVAKLAENCKQLTQVAFSNCQLITDEGVAKLSENCKQLTQVDLSHCDEITDEGVAKLADNCKQLTQVDLSSCHGITDEGVAKLAENCKQLKQVDLSSCDEITDEGVAKLAENCKQLTGVSLNGCGNITDEGVAKLAENCKQLTQVDLSLCRKITDEGVAKLADNCKQLAKVSLLFCDKITDEGVAKLAEKFKMLDIDL